MLSRNLKGKNLTCFIEPLEKQIAQKVWSLRIYCLQPSDNLLASLALSTADRRS